MRRRRAVFLLALALACGGLAASEVGGRVAEVESRTGRPVPVVVAAREVRPGAQLKPADLAVRDVPSRFMPVDAARSMTEAVGLEVRGGLQRGAYVTATALGGRSATVRNGGATLRRGERAVQVAVAGGDPLSQAGGPGSRVDVLVSTEPRDGAGRTFLALEDVELLALGGAPSGVASREDGGAAPSATATLRVTQRQAVYLTAAQNFAREVRLLPRPPGDGGRGGRSAVSAAGL